MLKAEGRLFLICLQIRLTLLLPEKKMGSRGPRRGHFSQAYWTMSASVILSVVGESGLCYDLVHNVEVASEPS